MHQRPLAIITRALATGALATGALAIGGIAVGAFAIGRLSVRKARFGILEIDRLVIREMALPPAEQAWFKPGHT